MSIPSHWPRSVDEARTYGALALFMDRAESAGSNRSDMDAGLEKMVDICRRLDGIPLAIEIVAAQLPLLGMVSLADRLTERLASWHGSRTQPARQQTMLAAIEWSYSLLDLAEQVLFRRLAVFSGGFSLAAAEPVCSDALLDQQGVAERLATLVEKSLVTARHHPAGTRYRLLEPLRAFARAKLEDADEATPAARRHALWLASLAQSVRATSIAEWTKSQAVSAELDNARAALTWTKNASLPEDRALGAKIFLGLTGLWTLAGAHAESERIARDVLAGLDEMQYPLDAALLTGHIVARAWPRPESRHYIELAVERFERLGRPALLSQCFTMLTYVYAKLGELERSESAAERALQLAVEANAINTLPYADIFASRSQLRVAQKRFDEARADLAEASRIAHALGSQYFLDALCLPRLAHVEVKAGNFDRALSLAQDMLASDVTSIKEMITLEAYGFLACIQLYLGNLDEAELAARKQLELARGDESMALEYFATIAAMRGEVSKAARLNGFVHTLLAEEPLLGFSYQRTDRLLYASLREQLSEHEIASQEAAGSTLPVSQAVAEALRGPVPPAKH
jgi:predicted ATPase